MSPILMVLLLAAAVLVPFVAFWAYKRMSTRRLLALADETSCLVCDSIDVDPVDGDDYLCRRCGFRSDAAEGAPLIEVVRTARTLRAHIDHALAAGRDAGRGRALASGGLGGAMVRRTQQQEADEALLCALRCLGELADGAHDAGWSDGELDAALASMRDALSDPAALRRDAARLAEVRKTADLVLRAAGRAATGSGRR